MKKLRRFNTARCCNTRKIVAEQIDNHQVFGALFGIIAQGVNDRGIIFAAKRRALHWLGGDFAAAHRKEQLWR